MNRSLQILTIAGVALATLPAAARATDYTTRLTFPSSDHTGVHAAIGAGFGGCGGGATSWRCPAVGALAVHAMPGVAVPVASGADLILAAPAGTTIAGGSVRIRYHVLTAGLHARLIYRTGNGAWHATALVDRTTDGVVAVAIPAGVTEVGGSLYARSALAASAVRSGTADVLSVEAFAVTLRDVTAPTIVRASLIEDALWRRGSLCVAVDARDAGLGIRDVSASIDEVTAVVAAPVGARLQPRPLAFHGEPCLDTTAIADGLHRLVAAAGDGIDSSGNRSAATSLAVLLDNTGPEVDLPVAASTEDRQPELLGHALDRASGVASVAIAIDDVPLDVATGPAGAFSARPADVLAFGSHVVTWTVLDAAGNGTMGRGALAVVDATPPMIDALTPADGALITGPSAVSFTISDALSGLAVETLRVAVDGRDVEGAGSISDGAFLLPETTYAPGQHALRVRVADRAGNVAERATTFTVAAPAPDLQPVTLVAPTTVAVRAGAATTIVVHVTRAGVAERGIRVRYGWAATTTAGSVVSDEAGLAEVPLDGVHAGTLWLRWADGATTVRVILQRGVTLAATRTSVCRGCWFSLRGRVAPAGSGVLLESYHGGAWHSARTARSNATGTYAIRLRLRVRGLYVFRATTGGATSATVQVWVR